MIYYKRRQIDETHRWTIEVIETLQSLSKIGKCLYIVLLYREVKDSSGICYELDQLEPTIINWSLDQNKMIETAVNFKLENLVDFDEIELENKYILRCHEKE